MTISICVCEMKKMNENPQIIWVLLFYRKQNNGNSMSCVKFHWFVPLLIICERTTKEKKKRINKHANRPQMLQLKRQKYVDKKREIQED